jgi:23S rRNA (cytidine1920-2'-O)/16S rRNA (cytidine1409-2'-O)-methyltransferase
VHDCPNVTVDFGDVFTMPFENEKFDVLLMDITVSPLASIAALENIFPALKSGGMLMHIIKLPKNRDRDPILLKISKLGFEIMEVLEPEKKEAYVIAKKISRTRISISTCCSVLIQDFNYQSQL